MATLAAASDAARRLSSVAESEWFSVLSQVISSTLLFILIFGMSATVDVRHLREQVTNKFAILTGIATQFLIMPLLGFASVMLLGGHGLTEPMAISLLIVTASPGGSYSNWWCSMFNADLALSVTMTAISTMVSTVMLPANLLLYVNAAFGLKSGSDEGGGVLQNIDWASLFVSLAIVLLAIGMGLCASFKISSHRFNRFANRMGSLSGILLIIFSGVVSSLSGSKEAQVWGQNWAFYVGVTLPCLVGLFIATLFAVIARLRRPEVISVGVECCYQNVGIATSAAVAMFDDPIDRGQALCVPLFYGLMEGIVLGIYCIIGWKLGWTKAPRDEKFCKILVTAYEVEDDSERFDSGQMDEEMQQRERAADESTTDSRDTWRSNNNETPRRRRPWSLFTRRRNRKESQDSTDSPPRRLSLPRTTNEVFDSIQMDLDSITDLVSFPAPNPEYSRCRTKSEDSAGGHTAITAPVSETASNGSPSSSSQATSE
ncbi:hypothetical protein ACHAXT_004435 [Thalassiosira profunda]